MKNKKTIIIVVAAVIVVGAAYYGYSRWRQQQIAVQILSGIYGTNTGASGILNKIAGGGGNVADLIAQEAAKQDAKDKADAAKEAAKTPEDKYNEAQAAATIGGISPVMTNEIQPVINGVFGKSKIIDYSGGYMVGQTGSFGATIKVPRVVTADDLNKMSLVFVDKGYAIISSSVQAEAGEVSLMKEEAASISLSYGDGAKNQEFEVLYWQLSAE